MDDPALTFDAIWTRAGLGERQIAPTQTLRAEGLATGAQDTLPHLTITEGGDAEPVDAQLVVRELLGEGGMGVVHVARQPLLDRDVAIKRVRPGASRQAVAGLLREARYMGSLEHPNIVPVHALGADDAGSPVLVMKRVQATTWSALIGDPDHPGWAGWPQEDGALQRHVDILVEVCRAVAFAHARGVVHRDLKPENVLVGGQGEVYVLDWGIAAREGQQAPGGLTGTPAYMPPEMARIQETTRAMDIYLLGGCLYHVLAGRPPHPGDSLEAVLKAAHDGVIGPIPDDDPQLASNCRRALARYADLRWPSVQAFERALDRWRRAQGLRRVLKAAHARLEELREGVAEDRGPRAVGDALAACRFGFGQVLEADGSVLAAEEGLWEALRLGFDYALSRERLDEAESLLAELVDRGGDVASARAGEARTRKMQRSSMAKETSAGSARLDPRVRADAPDVRAREPHAPRGLRRAVLQQQYEPRAPRPE